MQLSNLTSISSFFPYSRRWKMQNNEDCASPVKVFTKKKLDTKAYNCLIYGQTGRKKGLQKALKLQNECNGYNISYFLLFIDSEKYIWISETVSVCWHPKCNSKFCNPKNLSFVSSQEWGPSHDPHEQGPSSSQSRATTASNPQFCTREVCMFFYFKKHHGDTSLVTM